MPSFETFQMYLGPLQDFFTVQNAAEYVAAEHSALRKYTPQQLFFDFLYHILAVFNSIFGIHLARSCVSKHPGRLNSKQGLYRYCVMQTAWKVS
jgi:hypothetical protein